MLVKALLLVLGCIVAFNVVTIAGLAVSEIRDRRRRGLEVRYLQTLWHVDRPALFRGGRVGASMARRPFRPWGGKPVGIALVAVTLFAGTALATGTGARRVATAVLNSVAQELGLRPAQTEVSVAAAPSVDVASSHVADHAAPGSAASPTREPSTGSRGDQLGGAAAIGAGSGSGSASATAPPSPPGTTTPPAALEAPGTLVALVVSSTRIELDWADVAGETGYVVRRSAGSGWESIAETGAGVSAYADGGLLPGTTYSYVVVATHGDAESPPSHQASQTTLVDPPTATTLDALALSSTEVQLSWVGVATATGYRIERSLDGVSWTGVGAVGGDATSYTDTGLSAGTTYRYRVVATNESGDAPFSNEVQVTTQSDVPSSSDTPAV